MIKQVDQIRGDPFPLTQQKHESEKIFNVRFRKNEVIKLNHRKPSIIGRVDYYQLYKIPSGEEIIEATYLMKSLIPKASRALVNKYP